MATTEVNGIICLDPAFQVSENDIVEYDGQKISPINKTIVIMLNKPKKVITTVKTPTIEKRLWILFQISFD